MNKTLFEILKSREDLSDFLFHFTSGATAREILESIISDNAIEDKKSRGVLCFTEAPLVSLPEMFRLFEKYSNPMYAPYGVAVRKNFLFQQGGRPVIYGSKNEINELSKNILWRFEEYSPEIKDFTWLREWRIKEAKLELDSENFFIITKTKSELYDLMFDPEDTVDVDFDGCVADGGYWGTATGVTARRFKGVSMEDLAELQELKKSEIDEILKTQSFEDTWGVNLGGFTM
jgi:hypothetical protein